MRWSISLLILLIIKFDNLLLKENDDDEKKKKKRRFQFKVNGKVISKDEHAESFNFLIKGLISRLKKGEYD